MKEVSPEKQPPRLKCLGGFIMIEASDGTIIKISLPFAEHS
jgi:hypothetical protein